ncbi:hypothetical protein, partial [Citricoccus sp.]|uniref:hypothetical protein n=1 Tax=Citricoccus sp. TaxID=1978372 RepID=UPI002D1F9F95
MRDLSAVEDAQADSWCHRVEVLDRTHLRLSTSGGVHLLALPATRHGIAEALHAMSTTVDPSSAPLPVDSELRTRHRGWVQLLQDLGRYDADLASLSRDRPPARSPWRYQRIERSGATVLITVTNGTEYLHHTVDLDAPTPP